MSAIGVSMIGAGVFALVALVVSVRSTRAARDEEQRQFDELFKLVTVGGLAVGLILIAVSLTKFVHFGSDRIDLAVMLGIPAIAFLTFQVLCAGAKSRLRRASLV